MEGSFESSPRCEKPPYPVYNDPIFTRSSSRIDEGYSEDVRSQDGSDVNTSSSLPMASSVHSEIGMTQPSLSSMMNILLSQADTLKAHFAYTLLQSCKTSHIAGVVEKLQYRLHYDPVTYLPPEIMFYVLDYLGPADLSNTLSVSKQWRSRALDPRLWRNLYIREGWTHDAARVAQAEQTGRDRAWQKRKFRNDDITTERSPKSSRSPDASFPLAQHDETLDTVVLDRADLPNVSTPKNMSLDDMQNEIYGSSSPPDTIARRQPVIEVPNHSSGMLKSPLVLHSTDSFTRTNWHRLFNLRRRLERNWELGRFTYFRLPHVDHLYEAHSQCVYTLQYSYKHAVSGSRDQTVRVWNLDTQRLLYKPLKGHSGSVLCLQYDDKPEEDVIISGGSDAEIIIWQFSTGTMIKRIPQAHQDSVLNLRFDERYLVTCSKDKSIKVWTRRSLQATDKAYPATNVSKSATYPQYIIDLQSLSEYPQRSLPAPLDPYALLMTFHGHNAAVNAIQIYKDQVVSASGDRKIKLWDIPTGVELKELHAHHKGIACVQYDGRRIVSGSSDNSVKIFDAVTGADVAVLNGHSNLVRSVQAEFGDAPGDEELQEVQARANDRDILERKARSISREGSSVDQSSDSRHFVFGAKLPPGGGGNRWTKIVSGSYDETLIIWKRDKEGCWVAAKKLRQEDALRSTGGPRVPYPLRNPYIVQGGPAPARAVQEPHANQQDHAAPQTNANAPRTANVPAPQPMGVFQPQALPPDFQPYGMTSEQARNYLRQLALLQQQRVVVHPARTAGQNPAPTPHLNGTASSIVANASASGAPGSNAASSSVQPTPSRTQSTRSRQPQAEAIAAESSGMHQSPEHHPSPPTRQPADNSLSEESPTPDPTAMQATSSQPRGQDGTAETTTPPTRQRQWAVDVQLQAAAAARAQAAQPAQPPHREQAVLNQGHGPINRVFKLQFDARRIMCCSQEPIIVGWDFAAGDEELIEASQFFGEPKG